MATLVITAFFCRSFKRFTSGKRTKNKIVLSVYKKWIKQDVTYIAVSQVGNNTFLVSGMKNSNGILKCMQFRHNIKPGKRKNFHLLFLNELGQGPSAPHSNHQNQMPWAQGPKQAMWSVTTAMSTQLLRLFYQLGFGPFFS